MVIFHCYVSSPEGTWPVTNCQRLNFRVFRCPILFRIIEFTLSKQRRPGLVRLVRWPRRHRFSLLIKGIQEILLPWISVVWTTLSGWWLVYLAIWKIWVSGKDDIPYMKWKIIIIIKKQTTNQLSIQWNTRAVLTSGLLKCDSPLSIRFGSYNWLVVDLPLWKIWKSVGIMTFPTEWKNKIHVPNH